MGIDKSEGVSSKTSPRRCVSAASSPEGSDQNTGELALQAKRQVGCALVPPSRSTPAAHSCSFWGSGL